MTLTGSAIHHLHTHMLSDLFKCRYCLSMFHTHFHMPAHHRLPHATLPECHVNLNLKALSGQRYIIRNVNRLHVNYLCHVLANTNLFHPRCRFALLVIFSCNQFATTQLSLSLSLNQSLCHERISISNRVSMTYFSTTKELLLLMCTWSPLGQNKFWRGNLRWRQHRWSWSGHPKWWRPCHGFFIPANPHDIHGY